MIRRMDLDADQKIARWEFLEAIQPQEPFSKMLIRARAGAKMRAASRSRERATTSRSRSNSQIRQSNNDKPVVKLFQ